MGRSKKITYQKMYPNFSYMRGMWDKLNSTMWGKERIKYHRSNIHKPCQVNSSTVLWEMPRPLTQVPYKHIETRRNLTETVKHSPEIFAHLVLSKRVLGAVKPACLVKTAAFRWFSIFKYRTLAVPTINSEVQPAPRLNKTAFTPVRNLVVVTERLLPRPRHARKGC